MDTLRLDLSDAHDHYNLFRNLLEAKEGEFTKAVSQSQTFWSLVYGANFDTAVFRLCRVCTVGVTVLNRLCEAHHFKRDFLFRRPSDLLPLERDEDSLVAGQLHNCATHYIDFCLHLPHAHHLRSQHFGMFSDVIGVSLN